MSKKVRTLNVQDLDISLFAKNELDYISLTDMAKGFEGKNIDDWLRSKSTIEFLGVWEEINNENFNYGEFTVIKNSVSKTEKGYKRFSVKQWVTKTNAIGLIAKAGRYGGTYAHKDIAFEFAMWLSPHFKLYLIKDWERLKKEEIANQKSVEWNYTRFLTKVNYRIHTDAVKTLIPPELLKHEIRFVFANEADLLNVALFGITAKQWREQNPEKEGNMRDYTNIAQLTVLVNLEFYNATLINDGMEKVERLRKLREIAVLQLKSIINNASPDKLK